MSQSESKPHCNDLLCMLRLNQARYRMHEASGQNSVHSWLRNRKSPSIRTLSSPPLEERPTNEVLVLHDAGLLLASSEGSKTRRKIGSYHAVLNGLLSFFWIHWTVSQLVASSLATVSFPFFRMYPFLLCMGSRRPYIGWWSSPGKYDLRLIINIAASGEGDFLRETL